MIEVDQLRELRHEVHALATAGVDGMPGADCCAVALEARRLRELADHLEVHSLGVLEESGYTNLTWGSGAAGWFAKETGLPSSVGRSQVRAARALSRDLHGTDQAWLDGRITREHVRVLADAANPRIREQIVALEDTLIGWADGRTFRYWRQDVVAAVSRLDQDGPEPADPTNTSATWSRSGAFAELRARFGGASVEVVEQVIEAKTDELFRRQASDRKVAKDIVELTRNQLRGQALVELLVQALGVDTSTSRPPRTAVTLVVRAERPAIGPAAYVAAAGWTGDRDIVSSVSGLNGDQVDLRDAATLLCDCEAHELLVDGEGNPLDMGRTTRWATPLQRKAVLIRDGSCAFPGCDCPVGWLDIHHLIRWEDGGTTDIANLVALCRHHHGVVHRKGWDLGWCNAWLRWTTPSGDSFWAQRHGQQRAGPAPPVISA